MKTEPLSIAWFLLLALFLHGSAVFLFKDSRILLSEKLSEKVQNLKESIWIEPLPKEIRPVVQTSRPKDQAKSEEKAKFYSEFKNRVEKETQGLRKSRFQEGAVIHQEQITEPILGDGQRENESENSNEKVPSLSQLMVPGSSPDHLPKDIIEGTQTLLNTDKVVYASYINRIKDEIHGSWVSAIQDALVDLKYLGKKLEADNYVTTLQVVLTKEGEVNMLKVISGSGITELDEAAKKAFWSAESFPNPPSQLISEDGFIRLTYAFHFELKGSAFSILPFNV